LGLFRFVGRSAQHGQGRQAVVAVLDEGGGAGKESETAVTVLAAAQPDEQFVMVGGWVASIEATEGQVHSDLPDRRVAGEWGRDLRRVGRMDGADGAIDQGGIVGGVEIGGPGAVAGRVILRPFQVHREAEEQAGADELAGSAQTRPGAALGLAQVTMQFGVGLGRVWQGGPRRQHGQIPADGDGLEGVLNGGGQTEGGAVAAGHLAALGHVRHHSREINLFDHFCTCRLFLVNSPGLNCHHSRFAGLPE